MDKFCCSNRGWVSPQPVLGHLCQWNSWGQTSLPLTDCSTFGEEFHPSWRRVSPCSTQAVLGVHTTPTAELFPSSCLLIYVVSERTITNFCYMKCLSSLVAFRAVDDSDRARLDVVYHSESNWLGWITSLYFQFIGLPLPKKKTTKKANQETLQSGNFTKFILLPINTSFQLLTMVLGNKDEQLNKHLRKNPLASFSPFWSAAPLLHMGRW